VPEKDTYAMIGGSELPPGAIREAVYPQPLSYTFHKGLLTLYGDPLMGLLLLDIYKSNNGYELLYQSQSYQLKETNDDKPQSLQPSIEHLTGVLSDEKITVQVAPLPTTVLRSPPFNVVLIGGPNAYYKFASDDHRRSLVVGGQFKNKKCQLIEALKDKHRA